LTPAELSTFFNYFDSNFDGRISIPEFCQTFRPFLERITTTQQAETILLQKSVVSHDIKTKVREVVKEAGIMMSSQFRISQLKTKANNVTRSDFLRIFKQGQLNADAKYHLLESEIFQIADSFKDSLGAVNYQSFLEAYEDQVLEKSTL
jgi:Ca2+-binding EF-hand superfamily protein